jgi:hypothetical protein
MSRRFALKRLARTEHGLVDVQHAPLASTSSA